MNDLIFTLPKARFTNTARFCLAISWSFKLLLKLNLTSEKQPVTNTVKRSRLLTKQSTPSSWLEAYGLFLSCFTTIISAIVERTTEIADNHIATRRLGSVPDL
jgi:hypothetical protein